MGVTDVVYTGPEDPLDPTNIYEVPGDEPGEVHSFRQGVLVEGVSAKVADVLKAAEGHTFKFGKAASNAAEAEQAAVAPDEVAG